MVLDLALARNLLNDRMYRRNYLEVAFMGSLSKYFAAASIALLIVLAVSPNERFLS